jgi:hypothetical protein
MNTPLSAVGAAGTWDGGVVAGLAELRLNIFGYPRNLIGG